MRKKTAALATENNPTLCLAFHNPAVFEPIVMSIILAQREKIRELEYYLDEVLWQKVWSQEKSLALP
jgi:hypothetical protein